MLWVIHSSSARTRHRKPCTIAGLAGLAMLSRTCLLAEWRLGLGPCSNLKSEQGVSTVATMAGRFVPVWRAARRVVLWLRDELQDERFWNCVTSCITSDFATP